MIEFLKISHYRNSIFENFENPQFFFYKIREISLLCFCFTMCNKEKIFTIEIEDGRKRPKSLVYR